MQDRKIRVLFLASWYPTPLQPTFGIFVKKHAEAIAQAGNQVTVLSLQYFKGKGLFRMDSSITIENGIETHLLLVHSVVYKFIFVLPFINNWLYLRHVRKHLQHSNFDLIHCNTLYPSGIAGNFLSKRLQVSYLITEHWSKVEKYMKKNILSFYGKKAYSQAAIVTAVSAFSTRELSRWVKKTQQLRTVPNVIDASIFSYQPKIKASNQLVFTAVAIWKAPKQPELFINALNWYSLKSDQRITLHLVGDGPLLAPIKSQKLHFEVIYHGTINSLAVAALLHQSDYFLHASDIETFSIVVAEALATGTPVLCSKKGALPELVNDSNGVLVDNTIEAWRLGLEKLLTSQFEPVQVSKNSIQKFSTETIGNDFTAIYKDILKQNLTFKVQ